MNDELIQQFSLQCEWNLVYTFILQYPQMIQSCVKHENSFEPCPQYVCSFLSRLCQQFSIYYRRTRVLVVCVKAIKNLSMFVIYLLKNLWISEGIQSSNANRNGKNISATSFACCFGKCTCRFGSNFCYKYVRVKFAL